MELCKIMVTDVLPQTADDPRSVLDTPPDSPPAADERSAQTDSAQSELVARMMSDETVFDLATAFFSRSDLLKRRWTKGLVEELLGPPDWTTENPHGPGFAPMQCWKQDRVIAVEASPTFPQARRKIRDQKGPASEQAEGMPRSLLVELFISETL
jgi:hypothetical protein